MSKRKDYIKWLSEAKENEKGEICLSGQAVKDIIELLEAEPSKDLKLQNENLKSGIDFYREENCKLQGQIKALAFAVRCNGVSGGEVKYEQI